MKKNMFLIITAIAIATSAVILLKDNNLTNKEVNKEINKNETDQEQNQLEKKLYSIISRDNLTLEDAHDILEILPEINFKEYSRLVNDNINKLADPFDITILKTINNVSKDDIENLMKTYKNTDGFYTDAISITLADFYRKNMIDFMKALYDIPDFQEHFHDFLLYEGIYGENGKNLNLIERDISAVLSSNQLSDSERDFAKKILEKFKETVK